MWVDEGGCRSHGKDEDEDDSSDLLRPYSTLPGTDRRYAVPSVDREHGMRGAT